jgi:anti-sigma factor RsiW
MEIALMTRDDRREELLHLRLDGALTEADRAEVEALLRADEQARGRADQLEALAEALASMPESEPPAGLAHSVMDRIYQSAPASTRAVPASGPQTAGAAPAGVHDVQPVMDGGVMRTKVLWGLAAAAAVVLSVFLVKGFPSAGEGTEGAIGAAKRYQAGQIAAADVKLGDPAAQEFLQSDLFDRLIKDDDVRKALSDPALGKALADPALGRALSDP